MSAYTTVWSENNSHMPATVELQSGLKTNSSLYIIVRGQLCQALFGSIQTIDISLMMLGMVKSHDLFRDRWLECLIISSLPTRGYNGLHRIRRVALGECAWIEC